MRQAFVLEVNRPTPRFAYVERLPMPKRKMTLDQGDGRVREPPHAVLG
jgi:hypothetical protein